jgi:hypothetical protein
MRSERAVAIILFVRRLLRQRACTQSCLQGSFCLSFVHPDMYVRLALSTFFVPPSHYYQEYQVVDTF